MRCPRCTGGRRRAAGAELGANASCPRRREGRTAVWGAGHPQARKSDRAGTEVGEERLRSVCLSPHTSKHPPCQPHLWLHPPPPSPRPRPSRRPSEPLAGAVAGAGPGNPGSQLGRSGDAAGPGAAYLGPRHPERRQPVAQSGAPGAAPPRLGVLLLRFSQTPSRARSGETGPGCRCGSLRRLRRRCRRQRTPRGGWKPV